VTFALKTTGRLISLKLDPSVQKDVRFAQPLASHLRFKRQMTHCHKTLANIHGKGL
jgi:hypothetical protein